MVNLSKDLRPSLENTKSRSSVGMVWKDGIFGRISCVVVDVAPSMASLKIGIWAGRDPRAT
jgi:hypothetical protein